MLQEIAKICLAKTLRQARLMRRINYLKMDDRRDRVSLEKESGKRPSEPGFPQKSAKPAPSPQSCLEESKFMQDDAWAGFLFRG